MEFPGKLHYTSDHEWISSTSGTARVGITAFAIEQLGDIVHVDLPEIGESFAVGEPFGSVESTKTVSDLNLPMSGTVVEVNEAIADAPESLQEDCYEDGWLIKVQVENEEGLSSLLDASAYGELVKD